MKEVKDEIVFVTSNKGKLASAQKKLKDIKLKSVEYDFDEPRSDDVKVIAKSKVKAAYNVVKKPCIALDAGFFIEELNGFPRAYVNFALDTLGIDGILKLMENVENRKCAFKECLAYFDGENLLTFDGNIEGTLSKEPLGLDRDKKWSDLWYIFIPYGYDLTLAEMSDEQRNNRKESSHNINAIDEFNKYYYKVKKLKK